MKLPKPENWTPRTSERVIKRINKLFSLYEKHSRIDEYGDEMNAKAGQYYSEALSLFAALPVEDRPKSISHC